METLGEDILVMTVRPNGTLALETTVRFGLAGSELVRLAALQRVTVTDGRISVLDRTPTGDERLDAALQTMSAANKPPKAKDWVAGAKTAVSRTYLAQLEAAGVLRSEQRKALRMFTMTRWQVVDVARLAAVRARLGRIAATEAGSAVAVEDRAFAGLAYAVGLGSMVFPGRDGTAARRRLKEIARRDKTARDDGSVDAAVRAATASTEAAVRAAVDASIDASIDASVDAAVHAAHSAAASYGGHGGGGGGGHH